MSEELVCFILLWLAQYVIVHCQYFADLMQLEHLFSVELYSRSKKKKQKIKSAQQAVSELRKLSLL